MNLYLKRKRGREREMPVKNKIDEARSQYPNIMSLINSKLFDSGITYYASQTQIVIPKRKKEEVLNIIYSLPIDADSLFILVDVVEAKGKIFVRKKVCI